MLAFSKDAAATTLKEISGDDQIRQAATIFRGQVERIDAAREQTTTGASIFSTVRFKVLDVYKGTASTNVSLRFLGGRLGDTEMKVDGMPKFETGKEYILFVSGGKNRACPVVGWSEGSLNIDRKARVAGEVSVTKTSADWLRHTSIARSRTVMPAEVGLTEFESLLRKRIKDVDGAP